MRILHWTEHYRPLIGGTELLVERLAEEQQRGGHAALVVTDRLANLAAAETCGEVAVRRLPFSEVLRAKDAAAIGRVVSELVDLKREFRPDVVHLHFNGMTAWFHLLSAGLAECPTVVTLHTPFDALPVSKEMIGRVLRGATELVAVSAALRRELGERDAEQASRCVVVHNGFPVPARERQELRIDPPVLLCLGRLSREKGVDRALRAMAALAPRLPAGRLIVAGDGPERVELEALARELGLSERVAFRGWIEPERVAEAIDEATIALVPSVWREPFGLVALQAAQRGRPVVASATGGLPEVVIAGETGVLVPAGDAVALAEAVAALLARPEELRRLGTNAAQRAAGHFSIARCAADYAEVYAQAQR